ncbi:hypothetical protein ACFU7T_09795 [Streptomyces sp. NPDC057555]|uniref:hypothetical protein n=1 Tax=Streptomyces sp. NPDC057555 TaxID=3346166 RepID=UPI0036CF573E
MRDARTGQLVDVHKGVGGLLRVCVHTACAEPSARLGNLRALLTADVLARVAELDGRQVVYRHAEPCLPEREAKALARAAGMMGIHPAAVPGPDASYGSAYGGRTDVHVLAPGGRAPRHEAGLVVEVGPTRTSGGLSQEDLTESTADLLPTRLALLTRPHAAPLDLTPDELARATRQLTRWREHVATWATFPSRPMHHETARHLQTALHDDLDTPTALEALRRLEKEPGIPDGARFELFVYADRVLALELPREVGAPRHGTAEPSHDAGEE